jgi:hypothetical protein
LRHIGDRGCFGRHAAPIIPSQTVRQKAPTIMPETRADAPSPSITIEELCCDPS